VKVIANSSVLIGLSSIGRLAILPQRFPDGVIIPEAVWREIVEAGVGRPGAEGCVATADWLTRQAVENRTLVLVLQAILAAGEGEVIGLAQEIQADLVLLDEQEARSAAQRLNLPILGTVGLLVWAKRRYN